MIFWIFVALGVTGFVLGAILCDYDELFIPMGILGIAFSICMLPFVISANVGIDAKLAEKYEKYDSLVYQYENDIYENDNDLGKRELMKDIENWNSNLAYKQKIQDNVWVGIFYPDIYDHLEFIELK